MIHIYSQKRNGVWFTVAVNERRRLVGCNFSNESRLKAEKSIKATIPPKQTITHGLPKAEGRTIMDNLYRAYLGRASGPKKLDFLDNVSEFRKKVYLQLCRIPRGKVTTYGAIAKKLGSKKQSRAVGTAVATNPISLIIPCHRVLPSTLRVGNYGMPGKDPTEGGPIKHALLKREGVKFIEEKVAKECVWSPN